MLKDTIKLRAQGYEGATALQLGSAISPSTINPSPLDAQHPLSLLNGYSEAAIPLLLSPGSVDFTLSEPAAAGIAMASPPKIPHRDCIDGSNDRNSNYSPEADRVLASSYQIMRIIRSCRYTSHRGCGRWSTRVNSRATRAARGERSDDVEIV